jgi:MurNAc alpha-1-phosphate uridylyltransferase
LGWEKCTATDGNEFTKAKACHMTISAALIFAAGFGTRMGTLTKTMPKPMIPVAGKPLIDYAIDLVTDANIQSTVVNLHYFPEQLETHLAQYENITTLREKGAILETGGGLKNALSLLGNDPVITLNSDAVWTGDNPISALLDHWKPDEMDALLVLIPTQNAQEHRGTGDFNLDKNTRLSRRGDAPSADYVYAGAQIIKTDLLAGISETSFSLNFLWDQMLAADRVYGVVHHGGWVDVGRPKGIAVAEAELAKHV